MPTPDWGPQAGVPMDQETFNDYVANSPPPDSYLNATPGNPPRPPAVGLSSNQLAREPAKDWEKFYLREATSSPVSTPQFQTANQDQARLEQQRVIQELQRQAAGDMGSLAQQQLAQSYGQARAQQSSLGSTMRGQGAGAAMRGIQQGQAGIQRSLPGEQQMLMLQEQQAAQALLAQMLGQQQGQDITQATGMAGGKLQGDALNQAMQQFYLGNALQSGLTREQLDLRKFLGERGLNAQQLAFSNELINSLAGAGATGLSTLFSVDGKASKSNNSLF